MCIPCYKTFLLAPKFLPLTLTLKFDLLVLIFCHMTESDLFLFLIVTLTLKPDLLLKKKPFIFAITFIPEDIRFS